VKQIVVAAALALAACGKPQEDEVVPLGPFDHRAHAYEFCVGDAWPRRCYSCHHLSGLDVSDFDCERCHSVEIRGS
jgi:hypothetical protein